MAPLSMRRDIAMLGFLRKRMLGDTRGNICSLLPLFLEPEARRCTRFKSDRPSRFSKRSMMGATLRSFGVPFSGSRVSTRCELYGHL